MLSVYSLVVAMPSRFSSLVSLYLKMRFFAGADVFAAEFFDYVGYVCKVVF